MWKCVFETKYRYGNNVSQTGKALNSVYKLNKGKSEGILLKLVYISQCLNVIFSERKNTYLKIIWKGIYFSL